jgi:hypothetical protein
MKASLKEIWKNRKQIIEGITNSMIRSEFVEHISKLRMDICNSCDDKDTTGDKCVVAGSKPCCSLCGCSLAFKTRALSSDCPADKWKAIISEEEEDELDKL